MPIKPTHKATNKKTGEVVLAEKTHRDEYLTSPATRLIENDWIIEPLQAETGISDGELTEHT